MATRDATKTAISAIAQKVIRHYSGVLHSESVKIVTPFVDRIPIASLRINQGVAEFIKRYEPRVSEGGGLFPHQRAFLESASEGQKNFILTTATGSGKSLCYWSWVFDHLRSDPSSTALLCFPTQALMWSQAERLDRISEPSGKCRYGSGDSATTYGGTVAFGKQRIGWSVWHGTGTGTGASAWMKQHEQTPAFNSARIRISTLDKAHWSLLGRHKQFAERLVCVVLDEAHMYSGVFGANVHYFLRRLYGTLEALSKPRPGLFLSTATISQPVSYASSLLSLDPKNITAIEDSFRQVISLIPTGDVPNLLASPPDNGLLKVVLLLNDLNGFRSTVEAVQNERLVGPRINCIYFSQSKYQSKLIRQQIEDNAKARTCLIYDADLSPADRRKIEKELNSQEVCGKTVLATSALELGVDIEGLDACFIDDLPPRRADLLQRIGRVGRRIGKPGLVVLRLTARPHDQTYLEDGQDAFRLDRTQILPIPTHIEMFRLKHALAFFDEWEYDLKQGRVHRADFDAALNNYFGCTTQRLAKDQFLERYGDLVDTSDKFWVHKGFRASATSGKIPLLLRKDSREVAYIDDSQVFRDAHPGAVYLGHDLRRYRVVAYEGRWKQATWNHPDSDWVLAKWLPSLSKIIVVPEKRKITTRGMWRDRFDFYQSMDTPSGYLRPAKGMVEYGIWEYERKWDGYFEVDLDSGHRTRVTLAQATTAFQQALQSGDQRSPFLFPLSYRTLGWKWEFGQLTSVRPLDDVAKKSLSSLVEGLFEHFVADAVESRPEDMNIQISLVNNCLRILDESPGGNGLSEALLRNGRITSAISKCMKAVSKLRGKDRQSELKRYLVTLTSNDPGQFTAETFYGVFRDLSKHWTG